MRIRGPGAAALIAACSLAGAASLPSCQGDGRADWGKVQPAIEGTCMHCHESKKATKLIADVKGIDNSAFTSDSFPDAVFPKDVIVKSVDQVISGGDSPGDATIAPDSPKQKAWLLHELDELAKKLSEDPPPDYGTGDTFDHFVTSGKTGEWEGCDLAKKLDDGAKKEGDGMPPQWAPKIFELLKQDYREPTDKERQDIHDYVDALLPGGIKACSATGESS